MVNHLAGLPRNTFHAKIDVMSVTAPLRVFELLAARLCHDLISPVAAIANGAELLGEDDPDFVREAVALVGNSARNANARLQYFRFAYGFGGGGLAGPAPHQLAADVFRRDGDRVRLRRGGARAAAGSAETRLRDAARGAARRCRAAAGWCGRRVGRTRNRCDRRHGYRYPPKRAPR